MIQEKCRVDCNIAALMYISRSYFLELGLKPDLVCNPLLSKVLVA